MTNFEFKDNYNFNDLVDIIRILRAPGGCPWDRVQTHSSIRRNFIEEVCEVVEAIDTDNPTLLCEELGDVMMQVAFHTVLAEEDSAFTMSDVTDGVCKKLIFRHPHVFSDTVVDGCDEVLSNWDKLKRIEKGQESCTDTLKSVAVTLPALWRAEKIQNKAKKSGLLPADTVPDADSLCAAMASLNENSDLGKNKEEAIGDLLFAAVALARHNGVDPENALNAASNRFIAKFEAIENSAQSAAPADGEK